MSGIPKPRRFDYPLRCRIFGHRWTECAEGWYCWGGAGHAITDEGKMTFYPFDIVEQKGAAALPRSPSTIFVIRDNTELAEGAFRDYIMPIPQELIVKRKNYRVELADGTRIICMTRMQAEQGTRGYSNVRYA